MPYSRVLPLQPCVDVPLGTSGKAARKVDYPSMTTYSYVFMTCKQGEHTDCPKKLSPDDTLAFRCDCDCHRDKPRLAYTGELADIEIEAERARKLFPNDNANSHERWLSIVTEEYLETVRELNDIRNGSEGASIDALEREITQTAAMLTRWLHFLREERERHESSNRYRVNGAR